jgi:hypothetical protein
MDKLYPERQRISSSVSRQDPARIRAHTKQLQLLVMATEDAEATAQGMGMMQAVGLLICFVHYRPRVHDLPLTDLGIICVPTDVTAVDSRTCTPMLRALPTTSPRPAPHRSRHYMCVPTDVKAVDSRTCTPMLSLQQQHTQRHMQTWPYCCSTWKARCTLAHTQHCCHQHLVSTAVSTTTWLTL